MVLNESIPDLLSGPINMKWEEGAPAPVPTVGHTAVLYKGAMIVMMNKHLSSSHKQVE